MEGLIDVHLRDFITAYGGYDHCVTEFLRVVDLPLPDRVFYRICPEASSGWKTPYGTPVHLQLLGSNPESMAINAASAARLGAPVIDLNFGCPAKTVNKNEGGAILLRNPQRVHNIIHAVRKAVPDHIPVTAKMRLGYEDKSLAIENARAVEAAGAARLTVHARTKLEGYKPPAHWEWVGKIREAIRIPVTANGEIWTLQDAIRCREISGCEDIMIGRGAIVRPDLARMAKNMCETEFDWPRMLRDIIILFERTRDEGKSNYAPDRVKQWLGMLSKHHSSALACFEEIKRMKNKEEIFAILLQHLAQRADVQ